MGNTREFEYKGRRVKVAATKTASGKYIAVPIIDGEVARRRGPGDGKGSVNEALGEGERQAKNLIDAQD